MDLSLAVVQLNEITGRGYRLVAAAAGGQSGGAFFVEDVEGTRWVLKYAADGDMDYHRCAGVRLDRLRSRGVPIARQEVHALAPGVAVVQELLPGESGKAMTVELFEQLVGLNRLQHGLADEPAVGWCSLMQRSLSDGLAGYCEHGSLRIGDERTRNLLDQILDIGRTANFGGLPAEDVVHYDLHPDNILTTTGTQVSGIVDWAVFVGDALFDLVMLAFTSMRDASSDAVEAAWTTVFDVDRSDRTGIYVAHVCLRLVDWIIRHDGLPAANWAIEASEKAMRYAEAGTYAG